MDDAENVNFSQSNGAGLKFGGVTVIVGYLRVSNVSVSQMLTKSSIVPAPDLPFPRFLDRPPSVTRSIGFPRLDSSR